MLISKEIPSQYSVFSFKSEGNHLICARNLVDLREKCFFIEKSFKESRLFLQKGNLIYEEVFFYQKKLNLLIF